MHSKFESVSIDTEVFAKYPTYSCFVMVVEGISGGESDERSEAFLSEIEELTLRKLNEKAIDEWAEFQVWREAFNSFGVKPRVARSSAEALVRRLEKGLPRIDMLTDLYNAISVKHMIPIGGENLEKYVGAPRLAIAKGDEKFDTFVDGELVNLSPENGEVVWRDDQGVTCRRWNWRQCVRTRLDHETSQVLFIVDGLGVNSAERAVSAGQELLSKIQDWWPESQFTSRLISN